MPGFRMLKTLNSWILMITVVYFKQLLGAAGTQKLIELLFSAVFNLLISAVKSLKKGSNQQKRLKTAEKSSSTSFWVRAAPKSW